jgi:general secretion pathway protein B
MSSILDALERASQDRSLADQDLIPKRHTDSLSNKRRGKWLLVVLATLAISALAYLIYWIQVAPSKADSQDAQPLSQSISVIQTNPEHVREQAIDAPTPSKPDLESQLIGSGVPSEHSLLAEAKLSRSSQVNRPVRSEKTSQTDKIKKAGPDAEVPQQAKSKRIPDASRRVANREISQQLVVPEKKIKPLIPEASEKPAVAKPESITNSDEQIPLIWELPQPLRETLEQLKISIHVYHENPQRRFVIINMHRYAEGERLNLNGYRLKRIDREGIVVDYGDGLVRLLRERY